MIRGIKKEKEDGFFSYLRKKKKKHGLVLAKLPNRYISWRNTSFSLLSFHAHDSAILSSHALTLPGFFWLSEPAKLAWLAKHKLSILVKQRQ